MLYEVITRSASPPSPVTRFHEAAFPRGSKPDHEVPSLEREAAAKPLEMVPSSMPETATSTAERGDQAAPPLIERLPPSGFAVSTKIGAVSATPST